ncbi:MAG: 3-deoxy-8-phosphooctulonate synthase [Alphaproteobacteria bacterium]|jgi:2-dehydro-3-deoxyphosphooctonate aldolase (KDO 8-P synthase)
MSVFVGKVEFDNDKKFSLIAGPCQLESESHAIEICEQIKEITSELGIGFVYKSSFDKANRTSLSGQRGLGIEKTMQAFEKIKKTLSVPVITDIHEKVQCEEVAKVVDCLQIPAFLCRQTDLLVSASKTGLPINVKKGQFLAPWDMKNVVNKITQSGNENVMVCERGTSFGYNTLVSDFRAIPIMEQEIKKPIIFDATHSVQQPGGQGGSSGGQREFVPVLARCAISVGVAGIFMETHEDPDNAPSDGSNMVNIKDLKSILKTMCELDNIAKQNPIKL